MCVCVCVCVYSFGAGGGGSGGSILMEACNVSGAGLVSAKGGPSRADEGSGAGGGGRVSIRAGHVSSQLVVLWPLQPCVICFSPEVSMFGFVLFFFLHVMV